MIAEEIGHISGRQPNWAGGIWPASAGTSTLVIVSTVSGVILLVVGIALMPVFLPAATVSGAAVLSPLKSVEIPFVKFNGIFKQFDSSASVDNKPHTYDSSLLGMLKKNTMLKSPTPPETNGRLLANKNFASFALKTIHNT